MLINYWQCKFKNYEEYWDGESEDKVYGCLHPDNCGLCECDNKWAREEADCPIAQKEGGE